eukprot:gene19917-23870_t
MAWWKLMVILGVISFVILGGVSALIILLEGYNKIKIMRLAITAGVVLVEIFFTVLSFISSRTIQKRQDEEEENLHGHGAGKKPENVSTSATSKDTPPCKIEERDSSAKSSESSPNSAVVPA